ncbi:MAG: hypothetical protein E7369_00530 [Clostridiales bacterium]|nr:hypothetical protein [Clostridiales bacterium]
MISKKIFRILSVFIISVCMLSVGGVYATWQYALPPENITKSFGVEMTLADGVYITDAVVLNESSGVMVINGYQKTNFNTKVTLANNIQSYAKVNLTVYNKTSEIYAFNAVKYFTENYSNQDIIVALPDLRHGDEIQPNGYLEFEATYGYKKNVSSNKVLDSIVTFEFTPLDELPELEEVAVSGALGQFNDIINEISQEGTLDILLDQMDDYANNDRHDDSYIGNVGGASENDIELLEDLFQGNLLLNIDGVDTEVTIIIKRENIDGDTTTGDAEGNELSIYMTTDDLENNSWFGTAKAPVYVSVFTSFDDGDIWVQLGDMYAGTATIKRYDGWMGSGSFDTDTWRSTTNNTLDNIIAGL